MLGLVVYLPRMDLDRIETLVILASVVLGSLGGVLSRMGGPWGRFGAVLASVLPDVTMSATRALHAAREAKGQDLDRGGQ